jgi:hypothetical protein
MLVYLCIDDTDNLDSPGTGHLAERLAGHLEASGWGLASAISRHQLFVHPAVPYTSHNSAMCFTARLRHDALPELTRFTQEFLARESAPGSDPGFCLLVTEACRDWSELIRYGQRAKREVLTKAEAFSLAQRLEVHLSEHGGTGGGVIGALAGVGLRLGGNDGRMKGKLTFPGEGPLTVAQLLAHPQVQGVETLAGQPLPQQTLINRGEKMKTILRGGRAVFLALPDDHGGWRVAGRADLGGF